MHMAQVLMTKLLVDILTADKFFTNSPEKPNRVTQQTQSKHLQVTGNSPPPWQRQNYFPTPIFGYYCCSKFSMYRIYKTQKLPPHCSIKSLSFSYCSSFSNMGDEQQPNYISLSSTWTEALLSVAGKLLHFRANKDWKESCAMMAVLYA